MRFFALALTGCLVFTPQIGTSQQIGGDTSPMARWDSVPDVASLTYAFTTHDPERFTDTITAEAGVERVEVSFTLRDRRGVLRAGRTHILRPLERMETPLSEFLALGGGHLTDALSGGMVEARVDSGTIHWAIIEADGDGKVISTRNGRPARASSPSEPAFALEGLRRTARNAQGNRWQSDIVIHNPSRKPVEVRLTFVPQGADFVTGSVRTVNILGGQTLNFEDALGSIFKIETGSGTLFLSADQVIAAHRNTFETSLRGEKVRSR